MSQNITITTEPSKLFNGFAFLTIYNFQVFKMSKDAFNGYFRTLNMFSITISSQILLLQQKFANLKQFFSILSIYQNVKRPF